MRNRFGGPPINQTSATGMQTCVVRISGLCFNFSWSDGIYPLSRSVLWSLVIMPGSLLVDKIAQKNFARTDPSLICVMWAIPSCSLFEEFTVRQYCHRKPRLSGYNQCGTTCRDKAKVACLLCKSRPKFGRYHLCGQTCKQIAVKETPLLLEAPPGHSTYDLGL
jgi:hypothetical protein